MLYSILVSLVALVLAGIMLMGFLMTLPWVTTGAVFGLLVWALLPSIGHADAIC